MESGKIDPALVNIPQPEDLNDTINAINVGLDLRTNTWEVIVKYNGNINIIEEPLNANVEILSASYAIVTLPQENINRLVDYAEVEFVEKPKMLGIIQSNNMIKSCITSVLRDTSVNLTGAGVIVAILDSGIDYAHPDFLNEDGTSRILYLWDQTINGNSPSGFNDGWEYTQRDINMALQTPNVGDRIGVVPSVDQLGHGTGVAGIACGRNVGAAPGASIIVVKLGRNVDKGFARTTELMRGIKYVVDKAETLNMPVAINISFGTNDGSHDGRSLFETFIDEVSQQWKTNIIVASGNEGDTGKHYEGRITQGQTIDVEFSVGNNLQSLPITLWKSFVDRFSFEIISPQGVSSGHISFSSDLRRFVFNNSMVYISFGQPTPYNQDQEIYVQFVAYNNREISSGIWTIRITGVNVVQGDINIWLPITEMATNNTFFLSPSLSTTLTLPSTALDVITVGGYDSRIESTSSFTGRGYTRNFNVIKPDIVAPAVAISTSSPGGGVNPMTGTSFAAPHVTGAIALLMQWGIVDNNDPFLYGQKMKAYLQLGARRQNNISYPNPQWGYGTLCLANTLNHLREFAILPQQGFGAMVSSMNNNTVRAMESSNINKVISEDYVDFVIKNNIFSEQFLRENPDVTYNQILLSDYGILSIHKDSLEDFNQNEGIVIIKEMPKLLGLMGRQSLEASGILSVQNQPYLSLRGTGIMVGIIDTGINYTNDAFVYEDNTSKIDFIWDQTIETGTYPEGFGYGTEYTNSDINEALNSDNPYDIVPHRDDVGHGTFLASVACGREEPNLTYIGAAPDASLTVVKLKPAKGYIRDYNGIGDNVENVYQSSDLMAGIEYVRSRAILLNKPVVICISLGTNSGGHDGFSLFEEYISRVAIRNNVVITVSMGDEGRSRSHMMGRIAETGEKRDVELRIGDNESGLAVYMYAYESDKLSVSITSPTEKFRKWSFKFITPLQYYHNYKLPF